MKMLRERVMTISGRDAQGRGAWQEEEEINLLCNRQANVGASIRANQALSHYSIWEEAIL